MVKRIFLPAFSIVPGYDLFFWSYLFFLVKKRWGFFLVKAKLEGKKEFPFQLLLSFQALIFSFGPTFSF